MTCICDARRETGVEFWREAEPDADCVYDGALVGGVGRGDAGNVLRSGAILFLYEGHTPESIRALGWRLLNTRWKFITIFFSTQQ